ncbi:MAG: Transcriptional regulatory protein OmpR [Candidatus Accumulibacter phosphatis]|jgi:two-component system phosphate regulon response regulator OmpR|uniref:Transcriptional regulatory protein OmpR n=3 Tax=Betaproteobacteria incertae sedis TaxID=119066 RepID=A0A084Y6L8_9PROT|nr:MAG: Transcriptional regulatory protein OmpR [Candidatus Accumulibacter phosphatis]NMQ05175.1 response regulator [Candidatus Accumulibacter contiguus]
MQFIATIATTMKKILLIDDDAELRQLLATYLGRHGFDTLLLPDTRQLDAFLERYQPQLLILDLMLPGEDGLAACRRLRARGEMRPVIMLTARDEPVDRVIGLEMGADDYLGKPFDPRELVARIEAVLRRGARSLVAPDPEGGVTRFGEWLFDRAARQLSRKDQAVTLTSGEFALLNTLIHHARQPMKRERLLELTRGDASESFDRAIDVQIHRLRRLIETDPAHPRYLQTVWGIGYVFVPDAPGDAAAE